MAGSIRKKCFFFGDFIKILYGSRNLKNKILELKNILKKLLGSESEPKIYFGQFWVQILNLTAILDNFRFRF